MSYTKKNKNFFLGILMIFLIIVLLFTSCTEVANDNYVKENFNLGNSFDNLHNYGYVVRDETSIYFNSFEDPKFVIYKSDPAGKSVIKINDHNAYAMNIIDGWIFYINGDDNGKVYKMDTNGNNIQQVSDIHTSTFLVAYDGYLFIRGRLDENQESNKLYRINYDGMDIKTIIDENVLQIVIDEDYIYYSQYVNERKEYRNDKSYLWRTDLNGENKEMIHEVVYGFNRFFLYNGTSYCYNIDALCKIEQDNTLTEIIRFDNCIESTFVSDGSMVYCIDRIDAIFSTKLLLKQVNLDTGECTQKQVSFLTQTKTTMINNYMFGDKFYVYQIGALFVMDLDGNNIKRLDNLKEVFH